MRGLRGSGVWVAAGRVSRQWRDRSLWSRLGSLGCERIGFVLQSSGVGPGGGEYNRRSVSRRVTIACLTALFALTVYRAATLSFTTDEAFSYQLYIGATPFSLFRYYDANLHVLHTLAVWLAVRVFGLSELAFRLPSLAACALYFWGVYRLCRRAFGDGPLLAVAALALTANPLVLDHMAVGRGYGLALACFAWAFGEAWRVVQGPDGSLLRVAAWLALSVASNLTFLFPALALGVVLVAWRPRVRGLVTDLAGPAGVFTFLLVVLPFSQAGPGDFYFGSETFTTMNQSLAELSVGGRHLNPGWVDGFVLALLIVAAGAAVWAWRSPVADRLVGLTVGTFVVTAAGVAASHMLFALPYPWGRTGLYFLFLAPLVVAAGLRRWRGGVAMAVLGVLVAAMASGIAVDRFLEWSFDASSREMMLRIRERHGAGDGPVRIAASAPLERTLALYRVMFGMDWAATIEAGPDQAGFDYYVLRQEDRAGAAARGLREIFASEVSGTALAVPEDVGER